MCCLLERSSSGWYVERFRHARTSTVVNYYRKHAAGNQEKYKVQQYTAACPRVLVGGPLRRSMASFSLRWSISVTKSVFSAPRVSSRRARANEFLVNTKLTAKPGIGNPLAYLAYEHQPVEPGLRETELERGVGPVLGLVQRRTAGTTTGVEKEVQLL